MEELVRGTLIKKEPKPHFLREGGSLCFPLQFWLHNSVLLTLAEFFHLLTAYLFISRDFLDSTVLEVHSRRTGLNGAERAL